MKKNPFAEKPAYQNSCQADEKLAALSNEPLLFSLAWYFTEYHVAIKRYASSLSHATVSYRVVLFLAILFQIVGRLFTLVLASD